MDNISEQSDEIVALKSIYEDQWELHSVTGTYSIEISKEVKLFINLNPNYPSSAPPKYELLAPSLTAAQKDSIKREFQRIYEYACGSPIIFQWIEKLKEFVSNVSSGENVSSEDVSLETLIISNDYKASRDKKAIKASRDKKAILLNVTHGPTIVDRKSVFQGHVCEVQEERDVKKFMNYLLENKKIAQAKHNISAYRILLPNSVIMQDCDDDGETRASSRILHLLQILKLTNVMVVVTRWYGGIHLGPDRFKHINNAARQVLIEGGFIKK